MMQTGESFEVPSKRLVQVMSMVWIFSRNSLNCSFVVSFIDSNRTITALLWNIYPFSILSGLSSSSVKRSINFRATDLMCTPQILTSLCLALSVSGVFRVTIKAIVIVHRSPCHINNCSGFSESKGNAFPHSSTCACHQGNLFLQELHILLSCRTM